MDRIKFKEKINGKKLVCGSIVRKKENNLVNPVNPVKRRSEVE